MGVLHLRYLLLIENVVSMSEQIILDIIVQDGLNPSWTLSLSILNIQDDSNLEHFGPLLFFYLLSTTAHFLLMHK